MKVSWATMKAFVDDRSLSVQWIDENDHYFLTAVDGTYTLKHVIAKITPASADQTDFETNYKSAGNSKIDLNTYSSNELNVTTELKDVTITGGGLNVNSSCPSMPSTFKILFDEDNITVTSSYVTLYCYNGSGTFHGGTFDFNSDSVRVRLVVDGNEVFELTLDEVEDIQSFSGNGCNDGGFQNLSFISKTSGNRLNLKFDCPIKYTSSVLIEAQKTSNSNKRQDRQIIYINKES